MLYRLWYSVEQVHRVSADPPFGFCRIVHWGLPPPSTGSHRLGLCLTHVAVEAITGGTFISVVRLGTRTI